ncbi:MAG: ComF family protein [Ruminococcus sp.]|nr:ComF family protein [Ruminococcus sp.]
MKIAKLIRKFFFPARCPFCKRVIKINEQCCPDCKDKLPSTYIENFARGGYRCVSSFPYDGVYKSAIKGFKFNNKPRRSKQFAMLMESDIRDYYRDITFDIITSVPLHRKRQRLRGYNQSQLIGKELSALLNIPYVEVLEKHKDNEIQHTLKAKYRIKNVKNAYRLIDRKLVKNKNVLVVDDIITTGCTLGECSKVIRNGGAKCVACCTFCKVLYT